MLTLVLYKKELVNQLELKPYKQSTYKHPMNGKIVTNTYNTSLIINSTKLNNFIVNEFQTTDYPLWDSNWDET